MEQKTTKKFWLALTIFGLIGQVAWVVENMYLNVFIYKMFNATASDISLMVGASAVAATLTTILMGALSDYLRKRKLFMCGGYILWGISILAFSLVRVDVLEPMTGSVAGAMSLGVTLVILLDCLMTFLGSTANDAAFNAWMTDWGNDNNRGKIEGINAMMPLVSILVVFGGFMAFNLDKKESWTLIFIIIGAVVLIVGAMGIFLIEDKEDIKKEKRAGYFETLAYSFRPTVIKDNKLLYVVLVAFAVFGISINIFMPYLILYYEKGLGMADYVLIMAPAIIIAAIVTAVYGKLFDMLGFKMSVLPTIVMLMAGYVLLFIGKDTWIVFIGSLLMMSGYLTGMAIFGAMIKSKIPENKGGQFQGVRIIAQVLIPGVIGPAIGAAILKDAKQIVNNDGTTSFLPDERIFAGAFVLAALCLLVLYFVFKMMRDGHYDLYTESGERIKKGDDSWESYPRPQMRRREYKLLKDGWTLNDSYIKMPFPPQSLLSEYGKKVGNKLVYKCSFEEYKTEGKRTLIHFGAVDQIAEVYVNGQLVGKHEGGYLPFSMDITDVMDKENQLIVKVTDTLSKKYPYGKQTKKRGGMWYTPVSGIWQNVWMEQVPEQYIENIKLTPDMKGIKVEVTSRCSIKMASNHAVTNELIKTIQIELDDGNIITESFTGNEHYVDMSAYNPKLWSVEEPHIYMAWVQMGQDQVETYFGLRQIEVKEINGINRVCLNGKPIYMNGVLDQGYYPDGIFLPAEEEEYERDILRMKALGINMLRKHIKVEPEAFYYYCDKHGMLVMQDMVNNGKYSFIRDTALPTIGMDKSDDTKRMVSKETKEIFVKHMTDEIHHLYNHPCIIAYTIFNEGWGQFDSDKMYALAKELDSTRLYDSTSGWFAQKDSDFDSYHIYFSDKRPQPDKRPWFLSEFGGYTYAVDDHVYAKYASYGYGGCKDTDELTDSIIARYEELVVPLVVKGACGSVYTQLSDVEDEVNGFYTYDRKVCKVDETKMKELAAKIDANLKTACSNE